MPVAARRRKAGHPASEQVLYDAFGVGQLVAHRRRIVPDRQHVPVREAVGLQIEQVVIEDLPQARSRGNGESGDDEESGRGLSTQVHLGHRAHPVEALVQARPFVADHLLIAPRGTWGLPELPPGEDCLGVVSCYVESHGGTNPTPVPGAGQGSGRPLFQGIGFLSGASWQLLKQAVLVF